jgi:hypothetical protein
MSQGGGKVEDPAGCGQKIRTWARGGDDWICWSSTDTLCHSAQGGGIFPAGEMVGVVVNGG